MLLVSHARIALAAGLLLASSAASAATWQDVPEHLQLDPIGDSLRLNGTPMQIRNFHSAVPMEALLHDVQENWQRTSHNSVSKTAIPGWTVLNQQVGDEHRSFQVRPAGPAQVEGFVALTSPKKKVEPQMALRLPSDMTAVTVIDSVDAGKSTQQVIAVSRRSIDASASALSAQLRAGGWERHVMKRNGQTMMLSANKGAQTFDASLKAEKAGSLIMFNISKN